MRRKEANDNRRIIVINDKRGKRIISSFLALFALFIGPTLLGVVLQNTPMQWVGFGMFVILGSVVLVALSARDKDKLANAEQFDSLEDAKRYMNGLE